MRAIDNLFIFSPLSQFEVSNLIGVNAPILGSLHLNLTNLSLYSIFVFLTIIGLHIYANNDNKIIPNNWSISFETSFQSLNTMVREQIGANMEIYFPFIYSIKLITGNLLIAILTLIPFAIFLALVGLEIAVSLIQAFVFTLLVCSYLRDAIELH